MYYGCFDLLIQWSAICDVTVFDCAICNTVDRTDWLRILSEIDHINHEMNLESNSYFIWNSLRNLKSRCLNARRLSITTEVCSQTNKNKVTHLKAFLSSYNILKFFEQLHYLDISNSTLINEYTLVEFLQSLPNYLATLNMSNYNGKISVNVCATLVKSCPHLTSFNCSECGDISKDSITTIVHGYPQLTSLSLAAQLTRNSVSIDDDCLSTIASRCPSLTLLDISNHSDVTDTGLLVVAELRSRLQFLALTNCSDLTDKSICILVERCTYLKHLYLGGVDLTDTSLHSLATHSNKNLQSLSLCECDEISDTGVCAVVTSCTQLLSLNLQGCCVVTDRSILTLSLHCTRLTELNVKECLHICDYSLGEVVEKCSDLHKLHIDNNQNTTNLMFKIMKGMHSITFTHSESSSITSATKQNNKEANITIQRQFKRNSITPSVVCYVEEQSALTSQILCTVAYLNPELIEIHFDGLTDIRLSHIRVIIEHCVFLQIVKIDSAYCLPASTMCLIADTCTHLTTLHITDCLDTLDDTHVIKVVKARGATLTSMRLTSCGELSEEVVEVVKQYGVKLKDLVLNDLDCKS